MGRHGSKDEYLALFDKIRELCPAAALRTTFIVGFPGESEREFQELAAFIERVGFDRMGVFEYSPEDGTPASLLTPRVGKRVMSERYHHLMALQQEISMRKNSALVGTTLEVLVESLDGETAIGRSYRDAPEIDGLVYVKDSTEFQLMTSHHHTDASVAEAKLTLPMPPSQRSLKLIRPGDFVQAEVTSAEEYDLHANLLKE